MKTPFQCAIAIVFVAVVVASPVLSEINVPESLDDRLTIELFAAEPQIVTPTGIAVDERGRVLVIESHSHFRPEGYQGPPTDRIRVFEDTDGDGRADKISTYFEGTNHTMNLAVCHDGSVFVATRGEIFRLRDNDGDGAADERARIAWLDTKGDYPHNGLSGFAFDFSGHVYFGLGENLGAPYKLIGSDGATLAGGGEGGNIYRCRLDGSKLERIATGFWNPFHLCLDAYGRLFAVDNDPDWRPPCRLLHIVPGGDYGYKYRLGRRGTHPFLSWFGELPGTLPMVAGTGEAPSGIISYYSDNLPADYRGNLLGTAWGVHAIERYNLVPDGASFRSTAETVIKGDRNFRPVGIALAPDGSLFVSDWVDRSYNLHGKGRIWRIASAKAVEELRPNDARDALASAHRPLAERAARQLLKESDYGRAFLKQQATAHDNAEVRSLAIAALASADKVDDGVAKSALNDPSDDVRAAAIAVLDKRLIDSAVIARQSKSNAVRAAALRRLIKADDETTKHLVSYLAEDDPFLRLVARAALERTDWQPKLDELADPRQRREVAVLLRHTRTDAANQWIPQLLADSDPQVRFVAVQWIGEEKLTEYGQRLLDNLASNEADGQLFEAHLAALELLQQQSDSSAYEAQRLKILSDLIARDDVSREVLVRALRLIEAAVNAPALANKNPTVELNRIAILLEHQDSAVQVEAIRTLRAISRDFQPQLLTMLSKDGDLSELARAEVIASLSPHADQSRSALMNLASSDSINVRHEALRSLRGIEPTDKELQELQSVRDNYPDTKEIVDRIRESNWKPAGRQAADDLDGWQSWLNGGDVAAGQRLFFHPQGPRCFACHSVNGRGSDFGADLSTIGQLPVERLLESILLPSQEIAPRFVPWTIVRTDGTLFTGILVSEEGEHEIYADAQGKLIRVDHSEMEERHPHSKSIMPDGLLDQLTNQEVRDLLAFLRNCR